MHVAFARVNVKRLDDAEIRCRIFHANDFYGAPQVPKDVFWLSFIL